MMQLADGREESGSEAAFDHEKKALRSHEIALKVA